MRQFPTKSNLSDDEFHAIVSIAQDRWGMYIAPDKRSLVNSRMSRLMSGSTFSTPGELLGSLESSAGSRVMQGLFDALSTNHTEFFREAEHYDLLNEGVLGVKAAKGDRKLRIWSAGCSNGCEPHSLRLFLWEHLAQPASWDVKILATDLCRSVLQEASRGIYEPRQLEKVDAGMRNKYFRNVQGTPNYQVDSQLKEGLTIAKLNLMDPWKMKGPFDAIFCRNVMIYMDAATREKLVDRFTSLLAKGGMLFIGTSERVQGEHPRLESAGPSAYKRIA